ncbi:MAG TPA: hypothetical protein VGM56_28515 [Byssovorax sp.]|jgi:hypothetical protein
MMRDTLLALGRRLAVVAAVGLAVGCAGQGDDESTSQTQDSLEFDFRVELTPVVIQPGEERFICEYIPGDGQDHWLKGFDTEISDGTHHVAVMRSNDPTVKAFGPVECSGPMDKITTIDGMLPGSNQQSGASLMLPEGVALELGPTNGLYIQEHFVNITSAPMTTHVVWKAATMPKEDVVNEAGLIQFNHQNFVVPPGQTEVSQTCALPQDMNIVMATGHMHELGLEFSANVDGHRIFDTKEWSEPDVQEFGEGYVVKKGAPLTYSCTYGNATGRDVKEGYSSTEEMCLFIAIYYPAVDSRMISRCDAPASRAFPLPDGDGIGGVEGGGGDVHPPTGAIVRSN